MTPWVQLYQAHRAIRANGLDAVTELRRVLRALGELTPSVFNADVQARLQPEKHSRGDVRTFALGAREPEYIATWNLAEEDQAEVHLTEAHLTLLLSLDTKIGHLHSLTMMVHGKRHDGSDWTIAIHLPDDRETGKTPSGDRQGHGAGGHAALHCHVGPTLDDKPVFRVPMPPLQPADLLAWILSQVIPTKAFEPAPWADVVKQLNAAGS